MLYGIAIGLLSRDNFCASFGITHESNTNIQFFTIVKIAYVQLGFKLPKQLPKFRKKAHQVLRKVTTSILEGNE